MNLGELVRLAEESEGGEEWGEYTITLKVKYASDLDFTIDDVKVTFNPASGELVLEDNSNG